MSNNNGFIGETIYFWRKLLANPVRKIAGIALLAILWVGKGWIFHPINSTIFLGASLLILVIATVLFAQAEYLQAINWNSDLCQRVATKSFVAFDIIVAIWLFGGSNHQILFTIITVIIIVVIFKDLIFKFLK